MITYVCVFFFQAEDGIRDLVRSRGLGDVYKRQVGIESRGFIFGSVLAHKLNCGFIPVRKPGKLPAEKVSISYSLEYGEDRLEMHKDAIQPGDKVLVHDDLLATGGTMNAVCQLIEQLGGEIVQVSFIVELSFLNGRDKLKPYDVRSIVNYEDEK